MGPTAAGLTRLLAIAVTTIMVTMAAVAPPTGAAPAGAPAAAAPVAECRVEEIGSSIAFVNETFGWAWGNVNLRHHRISVTSTRGKHWDVVSERRIPFGNHAGCQGVASVGSGNLFLSCPQFDGLEIWTPSGSRLPTPGWEGGPPVYEGAVHTPFAEATSDALVILDTNATYVYNSVGNKFQRRAARGPRDSEFLRKWSLNPQGRMPKAALVSRFTWLIADGANFLLGAPYWALFHSEGAPRSETSLRIAFDATDPKTQVFGNKVRVLDVGCLPMPHRDATCYTVFGLGSAGALIAVSDRPGTGEWTPWQMLPGDFSAFSLHAPLFSRSAGNRDMMIMEGTVSYKVEGGRVAHRPFVARLRQSLWGSTPPMEQLWWDEVAKNSRVESLVAVSSEQLYFVDTTTMSEPNQFCSLYWHAST